MKFYKGLAVLFVTFMLGSCFEPPTFPVVPQIEFQKAEFWDSPGGFGVMDSLILFIQFKDGDGDLGLDESNVKYISTPFNNLTYYQANNADKANPIPLELFADELKDTINYYLDIPDPSLGKLINASTRKQPGFEYLPAFDNCTNYEFLREIRLLVNKTAKSALPKETKIVDSLKALVNNVPSTLYLLRDTLYYTVNPDHYNIHVDFLVKEPNSQNPKPDENGFIVFDWRAATCTQPPGEARFPTLTERDNALEGTLRFTMRSSGFIETFSIKTLKLRIQITDRALHHSNTIETGEFTLDKIKVN